LTQRRTHQTRPRSNREDGPNSKPPAQRNRTRAAEGQGAGRARSIQIWSELRGKHSAERHPLKKIEPDQAALARRYQSGEVDYDGHISRRGDTHLRGLRYEAATIVLTRTSAESSLRTWGLKLKERIGFKRAAVAVARKLAVVMHAMLRSGQLFERAAGGAA